MSQKLSLSRFLVFLILACPLALDSVRSQSLTLYLNQNQELTATPYPSLPPGTTGGEFEQVTTTLSWKYVLQHDISDTLYHINLLVGCVHPNGCVMEAEFILSHLGTETVLAKSGTFDAPLSGFTAIGYLSPARVSRQFTGIDPVAVAGDQLILRVKRVSGGTVGFVYLREAAKGTSSIMLGQISTVTITSNGGFEEAALGPKTGTDIPGWELYTTATANFTVVDNPVKEGVRSLSIEAIVLGVNSWSIQAINAPFTVSPNTEYTYSVWVKANKSGPVANFTVGDPSYNEWGAKSNVTVTSAWQQITFNFISPANAAAGRAPIHFSHSANAAYLPVTFYIDDFKISRQGQSGALATVSTSAATSVTMSTATLNGSVNPNGTSTTGWFEYDTSSTLSTYKSTSIQSLGSGTSSQSISATISGLSMATTYYFRVVANNAAGTNRGTIQSFTTTAQYPALITLGVTSIGPEGATLNGGVNPHGTATNAWFEYGTSPTLSPCSSTSTQSMGSGSTTQSISTSLTGLTPATVYYFRLVASNAAGTTRGSIQSFTTSMLATVTTLLASSVSYNAATLNGTVNPNGLATKAWFEYGTTATLSTFDTTLGQSMGALAGTQSISTTLTGLVMGREYFYRAAASNAAGTSRGHVLGFGTPTSVERIEGRIPERYELAQNYPNPFNPATTVEFSLPEGSYVTLTVHDVLGVQIELLIREYLSAGRFRIKWTLADIPSGVYFVRLETARFSSTRRTILLK